MSKSRNKIKDIAYNYVFKSPAKQLQVWFCVTYKKPLFHDKLEDHTEEELLINYYVVKFVEDEKFLAEYEKENGLLAEDKKDDEDWLKRQMKDDYVGSTKPDEECHDVF